MTKNGCSERRSVDGIFQVAFLDDLASTKSAKPTHVFAYPEVAAQRGHTMSQPARVCVHQ